MPLYQRQIILTEQEYHCMKSHRVGVSPNISPYVIKFKYRIFHISSVILAPVTKV